MLFEELLQEKKQEGRSEGRSEATAYILRLTKAMVAAGEAEQIPRLEQDPEFLADMLKKYHL